MNTPVAILISTTITMIVINISLEVPHEIENGKGYIIRNAQRAARVENFQRIISINVA